MKLWLLKRQRIAVSTQTYIMYTAHKQANEKQILQCLLLYLFDIFKSSLVTSTYASMIVHLVRSSCAEHLEFCSLDQARCCTFEVQSGVANILQTL